MARNVTHAGKVDGDRQIVPQAPGATFTRNDPAKFPNHGQASGKTPSNGVVREGEGPTITCNETLIPTPNADKPPKYKHIADKKGIFQPENTSGELTASEAGDGGPCDRKYPLARSYEKHGVHERSEPRMGLVDRKNPGDGDKGEKEARKVAGGR